jgi:hypothetical protein
MTGTIDDALRAPEPEGPAEVAPFLTDTTAEIEQAAGVLIFRFGIDAATARELLRLWGAEVGVGVDALAQAMIHEICQGDRSRASDPHVVRWLEDRLRHELPPPPTA